MGRINELCVNNIGKLHLVKYNLYIYIKFEYTADEHYRLNYFILYCRIAVFWDYGGVTNYLFNFTLLKSVL